MKKHLLIAVAWFVLSPSALAEDIRHADVAQDHGYATAAYEVYCGPGTLTVSNPKLRAKFDRLYRSKNSQWRSDFMIGYEAVASRPALKKGTVKASTRLQTCDTAASSDNAWLRFEPAARDLLEMQAGSE